MTEEFSRPVLVVSKCLGFASCRYNGAAIPDPVVEGLKSHVTFRPVCPEVEVGLGVPRPPIRIVLDGGRPKLFQPATGRDVTSEMESFLDSFFSSLGEVDGFILKYGSPSCGPFSVRVYQGFDTTRPPLVGGGFFGGEVVKRHGGLAIEDEGRLRNDIIREGFLSRLFALAKFRKVCVEKSRSGLVDYQAHNKFLFMAHHQSNGRKLGRIVGDQKSAGWEETISHYSATLRDTLSRQPSVGSWINAFVHVYAGIADHLTAPEKKHFFDTLEEFRDERIPASTIMGILRSWAVRFGDEYLLSQTILSPFPRALVRMTGQSKRKRK